MLLQFSIWPHLAMDAPHMSADSDEVRLVLDEANVRYEIGPMGTTVEGNWERAMPAIRQCHQHVAGKHKRVLTTLTIDDHTTSGESIDEARSKAMAQ